MCGAWHQSITIVATGSDCGFSDKLLGLEHHRTSRLRTWSITAVGLVRLASAYSLALPSHMAIVFPSAAANPAPSTARQ